MSSRLEVGVVDAIGLDFQDGELIDQLADRYEAMVKYADRPRAEEFLRQFDEMWETAIIDPNLRRLNI